MGNMKRLFFFPLVCVCVWPHPLGWIVIAFSIDFRPINRVRRPRTTHQGTGNWFSPHHAASCCASRVSYLWFFVSRSRLALEQQQQQRQAILICPSLNFAQRAYLLPSFTVPFTIFFIGHGWALRSEDLKIHFESITNNCFWNIGSIFKSLPGY